MSDDHEWEYTRRSIPVTRGWGPWKRTLWVPVDTQYMGQDGRRIRTFCQHVGLDPGAVVDPTRYLGFREIGPGDRDWRYYPADGGGNTLPSWQPGVPWEALDPVLAEDLQEVEELRVQRHRDRIERLDESINEINGRLYQHVQAMQDRIEQSAANPVGRLAQLRQDIDRLEEQQAERAREEQVRVWERVCEQDRWRRHAREERERDVLPRRSDRRRHPRRTVIVLPRRARL